MSFDRVPFADLEKAKNAYHPYSPDEPRTRSTSQPATLPIEGPLTDRDPLNLFPSREASPIDAAAVPPQPQPPVPLVPQLTPTFHPPDQLDALVVAMMHPTPEDKDMDVDKDAGGQHRPPITPHGEGLSASSAATSAAFARPQDTPLAGTGLPSMHLDVQENEKLKFKNQQLTMQIEAMKAMLASTNAAADDKDNEAKRYRSDAQTTKAVSEAREQAIIGQASEALNTAQREASEARRAA